ncbi:hypothetical protein AQI88_07730 [Streptomyces cellostaticus]|uniref:Uncharacterized protein n=1 Tax=Streptomyces cellostaticus TaxID=67285 RepID=A0A124HDG1_9ACTN|nr:hypothetical protein [Streptomyces cellostaticus]KUM97458.1 hypothetical protein AQI88_07730 [Streptomyces cellostaticus]GHI04064.1 hypothetical protein Scel_23850 [Streptomyces cellostaticus]
MATTNRTTAETAYLNNPEIQEAFSKVKRLAVIYGVFDAIVLATVIGLSVAGHKEVGFVWGRSCAVFASAVVLYWLTGNASRGERSAYVRIRIISTVLPIAIVGVDMIPGICPPWFAVMQAVCAVPLAVAGFTINGSKLRAAFPKSA